MLVGTKEIAALLTELGWSVQMTTVRKWVERSNRDELAVPFPDPVYEGPGNRRVWNENDVKRWAKKMGKIG
jgi:hypothetical protein